MSDEVSRTYVDTNGGLGGPALGAGFGGLIGSWFGQVVGEVMEVIIPILLISYPLFRLKLYLMD